jgi:hypothetical protein
MNCTTTHDLFSDYFDGGLLPAERALLEEHLKACETCSTEYDHFTGSLKALHETRPIETTRVFLSNVKAAATALPSGHGRLPAWLPWTITAATLSFSVAFALSRSHRLEPDHEELLRLLRARPAGRVVERIPQDAKKLFEERGLVEVGGEWVNRKMHEEFRSGKVCVGGVMLDRKRAAQLLAEEFPPPPPPVAVPATADEILEKAGYVRVNDVIVPKAWVDKWAEGLVQVGVSEWHKPSDFRDDFIREHNLVEMRGKLMTREQAEAIQAQQLVRAPDAATAANDFTRALEGLQIAPPLSFRGVTIYLLLSSAPPPQTSTLTLHAAPDKVELQDTLGLFTVQVKNPTENDLLLLAGEILTGGRCARVVTEDTLVPRGQTSRVSVLCVEPGAWNPSDRFSRESGHYVAPPMLRRSLAWEQGQGALWALLSKTLAGKPGQVDLFRKHMEGITEFRMRFSALPDREPAAVGMAVALGEAVEFVELFPNHATFASYFERLVAGTALEILERVDPPLRAVPAFVNSTKGVKQFLESLFFCDFEAREDGYGVRRDDSSVGHARLSGGVIQHALLFASGAPEWERRATYAVPKEKVKRAIDDMEARMKAPGHLRKIASIRELASINAPEIVPVLLSHMSETDPTLRRAVIQELGASGDKRATDPLLQALTRSRQDAPVFTEVVRALARLGDERAVDPLLRHMEAGEAELVRLVALGLPELLLRVRTRDLLERSIGRLIALFEGAEAQVVVEAVRTTLRLVMGIEFSSAADFRKWWNDRAPTGAGVVATDGWRLPDNRRDAQAAARGASFMVGGGQRADKQAQRVAFAQPTRILEPFEKRPDDFRHGRARLCRQIERGHLFKQYPPDRLLRSRARPLEKLRRCSEGMILDVGRKKRKGRGFGELGGPVFRLFGRDHGFSFLTNSFHSVSSAAPVGAKHPS